LPAAVLAQIFEHRHSTILDQPDPPVRRRRIHVISGKKVVDTVDLHTKVSNRLKFTPDGKTVLVSDADAGEVLVIDAATRAVTKKIPLGPGTEGILMPPSGGRAYVAVNEENYVAAVDLKTFTVVQKIRTGRGPDGMGWAGDARR
jgi:YVTN family beta-propeller protein